MKHFRFNLESVATLRNWEEERARAALSQALGHERRLAAEAKDIASRCEDGLAACAGTAGAPVSAAARVREWKHLAELEIVRQSAEEKHAGARRIREQKMNVLVDANRRVRVLESLRTRQQQAHRAAAILQEERELGDLINARHRNGASLS